MTQQEQAQIVNQALALEKKQSEELNKLNWIKMSGFKSAPAAPTRGIAANVQYPKPDPKFKFDWVCFLVNLMVISTVIGLPVMLVKGSLVGLFMLINLALYVAGPILACKLAKSHKFPTNVCGYFAMTWLGYIIYYFVMKSFLTEETRNSAEYKQACAALDEARNQKQLELDRKYEEELSVYNNDTMPKYNQEKSEWTEEHNRELSEQTKIYDAVLAEMNEFYSSTRIIPQQYHNIPSLEYLDSIMSSSEYDIMAAIDSYEKKLARDLEMQRIREQQIANEMAEEQNQLLYEQNSQLQQQNELQEERNNIAERARRDQRNAAFVNAVQNHNRNKYLKDRR